tara:strand:- start:121 stop:555 length:435 start_codon:yes stop_codon:yes gene_type:complete
MFKYLYLLFVVLAFGCGSSFNAPQYADNSQLIVTYDNVEVHRRSKYISQEELSSISSKNQELIIIFSSSWCSACKLTEKAVDQAKLKTKVYWLNVDEIWVQKLIVVLELKPNIPMMLHINEKGNIVDGRVGPSPIIAYLLTKVK